MDFILNKSTSYDDEILPSSRGWLTIMLPPEALKEVQDEIKNLREENKKLKEENEKMEDEEVEEEVVEQPIQDPLIDVVDGQVWVGRAKEIIEKGTGTLMFPSEYRKVDIKDIENWKEVRKEFDLTGRGWAVYIETNPNNKRQNKHIKYKTPHCVDKDWEGAYKGDFADVYFSDYVYGDVLIVRKP